MNRPDEVADPPGGMPRLRPFLKWLRYAPERWLHSGRRRALRRRLEGWGLPSAVLMVCQGNICRSPFAAAGLHRRLTRLSTATIRVDSAGFIGPGRHCPAEAVTVASWHGVDLRSHRSKLVDQGALTDFDLVVVMDSAQRRWLVEHQGVPGSRILILGDLDPSPIETRTILDPIDRPIEVYEQVYQRIERCIEILAGALLQPDREPPGHKA